MKRIDTINVIPFIDIMLVLLAIVLTTATFIARGVIPVELPESQTTASSPADSALFVTVSGTGQIFLDEEPADLGDFEKLIGDRGIDTPVILAVDTSAPFGAFFEIVDRLKALGFDDLSIETRPESP